MPNSQKKITAEFILLDANSKLLKNIEYKVTTVANEKEHHLVKGKTNSKGATYEFVKPINTNVCLYVKIGTKDFQKVACLRLPSTEKSKLKMRARVSAILIDSKLEKHGESPGNIKRKDYQVVKGDTLEGIAKKYNTNVAQLKRLNPKIKNIHKIYEGSWLKVPAQIGDVSKETTDDPSPKSEPTELDTVDSKNDASIDSEQPWYEEVWDSVKEAADEADAMIDKAEEAIKQGQQKVIDETIDTMESVADASEKLYDTLFGNKEDTTSSDINPSNNKSKIDESQLDIKKESGNNQKGNPTEQVTYNSDTTVYHIYFDGRIERQHPKAEKYAAFVYYDEDGGKHYLGKTKYFKTKRWVKKNALGTNYVFLVNIGSDKDNGLTGSTREQGLFKYRKGNVGYNIFMNSSSQRYYTSGAVMAAFLGALCKLGYDDISFNGASKKDGSPGVSSIHINGSCIDVRYLRKDKAAKKVLLQDSEYDHERTLSMVNTFHKFGWGKAKRLNGTIIKMLSERFINKSAGVNSTILLPHCSHYNKTRHNNHLHMQGFEPNLRDIGVIHKVDNSVNENLKSLDLNRIFEAIVKEEGFTTYMYLDTSTRGNKSKVTIGYGKMIGSSEESTKIPFEIDGKAASATQIKEDWNKVYNSVSGVNTYRHTYFESKSTIRITKYTAKQLTIEHIRSDLQNARKRFPDFDKYPVLAQEAILDMSYNLGFSTTGIDKFPTFSQYIKAKDFLSAAKESNRPQLKDSRNIHVKQLLEAAAEEYNN